MPEESDLLDLVVQWEDLRAAGRTISAEELCRDCPELLDRVKDRLEALRQSGQGAGGRAGAALYDSADPRFRGEEPALFATVTLGRWPSIPGYQIIDELSQGGMGIVYKARQIGLERMVAIKTMLPGGPGGPGGEEQRARFLREAKLMAMLQHPNILPIYEVGEYHGLPFLAMEYVDGGTLSQLLGGKPMPPRQAAQLTAVLARAVHVPTCGVIHRDLKPANVLLAADGTPKIGDFGLAKCFESPTDHTRTGTLLGTPSYMAPEQLGEGAAKVGPPVDVYALGATFYELLSGRPPFLADNALDTLQLVRSQEPISLRRWQPKMPADLDTICLKCLEKDPRRRYPRPRRWPTIWTLSARRADRCPPGRTRSSAAVAGVVRPHAAALIAAGVWCLRSSWRWCFRSTVALPASWTAPTPNTGRCWRPRNGSAGS